MALSGIDHFTDTVKLSPFGETCALSAHDGGVDLLPDSHYPGTTIQARENAARS